MVWAGEERLAGFSQQFGFRGETRRELAAEDGCATRGADKFNRSPGSADVRRRRSGRFASGNPPPYVGGYGVVKHVLSLEKPSPGCVGTLARLLRRLDHPVKAPSIIARL